MPSGDFFSITDNQTLLGQIVLNVFCFKAEGADTSALHVAEAFDDAYTVNMASIQSAQLSHDFLLTNNLNDLTDFNTRFTNVSGAVSGDCLPVFNTMVLFYERATRASRNGWKRFAGVPESEQVNGGLTSGALAGLTGMAVILQGPIVHPTLDVTLTPYIWRRAKGLTPQAFFGVNAVVARAGVSTQNTRKA